MTALRRIYCLIACDGCGRLFGETREYDSVRDARAAALASGWKIIPKLTKSGRPVYIEDRLNPRNRAGDACTKCATYMEPEPWVGSGDHAPWFAKRIQALEEENRRLRESNAGE